jgi:hypothetical protein
MAKQSFVWTCLPNGLTADRQGLRVSVLLSPHLDALADPPALSSFLDWLDWPKTLRTATMTFFANGQRVALRSLGQHPGVGGPDPTSMTPDTDVWKALFHPGIGVTGYQFNAALLDSQILSHSAVEIHELVRDLYSDLAARTGRSLPRIGADLLRSPAWKHLIDAVEAVDRWGEKDGKPEPFRRHRRRASDPVDWAVRLQRRFASISLLRGAGPASATAGDVQATAQHLARFELFHTPPLKPKSVDASAGAGKTSPAHAQEFFAPPMPDKAAIAAALDFHRIVGAMNAYPVMQRRLGLVADFVIERTALPPSDEIRLSVEVAFPAGALTTNHVAGEDVTPITHVAHTQTGFYALNRLSLDLDEDTRIEQGLLDLYTNPQRYAVLQADVDGAGLKLMNFARTLGGYQRALNADPAAVSDDVSRKDKEAGAPALRTGGMMLVQRDREAALRNRLEANRTQKLDAPLGTTELWAEDLTRGYRVDIWDEKTGVWRSLCRRTAEYQLDLVDGSRILVVPPGGEDETTVQLAATRSPDETYNHDILYLHEAMVSWTGWSLAAPPPGRAIASDLDAATGGKPDFSDEAEMPPGLNFRSRFQAVRGSLPRLRYGRDYDIRARAVDLAGNSLPFQDKSFGPESPENDARPFLRFEPVMAPALALVRPPGGATEIPRDGESMYRLAILSQNRRFDDATPTTVVARRYVVPPQCTVRDAELHGMLDAAGAVDASTFHMLANERDRDSLDPASALVQEQIARQGPLDEVAVDTTFAVWRQGSSLTYLPDPMAEFVRACFIGHPAITEEEPLTIPLYADGDRWPDASPFRIELFEDSGARPAFDTGGRVLRIPLGKGERATLRLSMRLDDQDLTERMGLWRWLDASTQSRVEGDVTSGRHWMFTPWQDVQLVHAVQRPLIRPTMSSLRTRRNGPGSTSAIPSFDTTCSLKSTDRLDLRAQWHEPDDDLNRSEPRDRTREDLAFQVKVTEERDYTPAADALPDHAPPHPDFPERITINGQTSDRLARKTHEFNDTRYRRIEYWLVATSRYREYLPAELRFGKDPVTRENVAVDTHLITDGPAAITWIQSSARPPAPQVSSVVPTFAWTRTLSADGTARSWRRGGGLRVYLERPWNVSGYGEMLAVVLPPAGFVGDPDSAPADRPYKKYVTQWGNDPLWDSPFVAGIAPTRNRFPLARWQPDKSRDWLPAGVPDSEKDQPPGPFVVNLSAPDGESGDVVEIAPHDVFFDSERQLWYCDIEITQGRAYWPFVRLALARYQPASDAGAHLSEVVLADFMQLASDRWLTIRAGEARTRDVTVYGFGYTNSSGARERADPMSHLDPHGAPIPSPGATPVASHSVVVVTVEELDASLGEDFGWRLIATGIPARPVTPASPGRTADRTRLSADAVIRARHKLATGDFTSLLDEGLVEGLSLAPPLWDGTVTLPANHGGAQLRIVVAEYEEYIVDAAGDATSSSVGAVTATGRRLVFMEHVRLN